MIVLGIDNGITGGLCAIGPGGIIAKAPMFIRKARKGNEIDVMAVREWVIAQDIYDVSVVIEEPGGSKSASAAASMAGSFHALRGLFESRQFPFHRITPQKWQKEILGTTKGDTKAIALTQAQSIWPQESWLATERCRKPHDGMIDAALIALYGRRKLLTD